LLLNELMLLNQLAGNGPADVLHDPVCGLVLDPDATLPAIEEHGTRHVFCSNGCRRAFLTRQLSEDGEKQS
jgi:YHS domain-containing protein